MTNGLVLLRDAAKGRLGGAVGRAVRTSPLYRGTAKGDFNGQTPLHLHCRLECHHNAV